MTRQEANREILARIGNIVEENPDLRFIQILQGLALDECLFYEESESTLDLAEWDAFKSKTS